jgi:phosphoglycerate dehydrogenase-like enzyme
MKKIAITDYAFADLSIEEAILRPEGIEIVSFKEKRSTADLIGLVRDADAVIVQFASVNAAVVNAMTKAKVIVRYGIGYDNVDTVAARERGIPVCNIPDCHHPRHPVPLPSYRDRGPHARLQRQHRPHRCRSRRQARHFQPQR